MRSRIYKILAKNSPPQNLKMERGNEKHFSDGDFWMANSTWKTDCLHLLLGKYKPRLQWGIILTPERMAYIKSTGNNLLAEMWWKRNSYLLLVEMLFGPTSIQKTTVQRVLSKLRILLPAIPLLDIYPLDIKPFKRIYVHHYSLQHLAIELRETDIYVHNGVLYSYEEQWNQFTATLLELEYTMLNELSQKEEDKHRMISITCGIYKHGMKECNDLGCLDQPWPQTRVRKK